MTINWPTQAFSAVFIASNFFVNYCSISAGLYHNISYVVIDKGLQLLICLVKLLAFFSFTFYCFCVIIFLSTISANKDEYKLAVKIHGRRLVVRYLRRRSDRRRNGVLSVSS